jgi:hypothetical protein
VVLNHGFVDGNKRTAMYAMAAWLEREGYVFEAARGAASWAGRSWVIDPATPAWPPRTFEAEQGRTINVDIRSGRTFTT